MELEINTLLKDFAKKDKLFYWLFVPTLIILALIIGMNAIMAFKNDINYVFLSVLIVSSILFIGDLFLFIIYLITPNQQLRFIDSETIAIKRMNRSETQIKISDITATHQNDKNIFNLGTLKIQTIQNKFYRIRFIKSAKAAEALLLSIINQQANL